MPCLSPTRPAELWGRCFCSQSLFFPRLDVGLTCVSNLSVNKALKEEVDREGLRFLSWSVRLHPFFTPVFVQGTSVIWTLNKWRYRLLAQLDFEKQNTIFASQDTAACFYSPGPLSLFSKAVWGWQDYYTKRYPCMGWLILEGDDTENFKELAAKRLEV